MRVQHPCGYGLGLLPPTFRLLVVIGFTSGLVFIHNLWLLIGAALVGIGLLLFAPAVRWVLVIVIVGLTACFYFIGNLIFSPAEGGGATFLIFRVNSEGFHYGLAGAVRMSAYLCTSLAFLWSTPIHELYDAVSPLRLLRGPALRVVRELQITMRSYVLIGQSLRIRGLRLDSLWSVLLNRRWQQLRGNLQTVKALFNAIIPRQFVRNREGAIAWANHHPEPIVRPRNSASFALEKVSVRYGRSSYPVLREITYEIPQGSFIFVAGPDRSGKTTLFRAIAGVVPRVLGEIAGTVYIHGIDTTGFSRMRQMTNLVIYIGQDPFASILGLTVGQEMCLWSRHERRARECLAAMGIDHLWERQTTKLSGGQQVRLVLAGLLASEAPVLLLDDPMDQLDPEGCQAFVSALRKLRESEDKIILITDYHNYDRLEDLTGVLPIIDGCTQPILPPQDLARPEFRQF
jgi:energy-coupling factor transporter ATP-binding protein EcfA2/energy-coupling factor transporter transmembrane protein EcfT